MLPLLVVALVATFLLPAAVSPEGTTYYVSPSGSDTNACSQSAPCGSLNAAFQAASAGDTVVVAAGTYGDQTVAWDGSMAAPGVEIRAAAGATPVFGMVNVESSNVRLTGPFRSTSLETNGAGGHVIQNVVVQHFVVDGQARTRIPAYVASANGVTWRDVDVSNVREVQGLITDGGVGGGLNNVTFDNVDVHDVYIAANSPSHVECIGVFGGWDITIKNSHFYNCTTFDIFVTYNGDGAGTNTSKRVTLENNVFEDVIGSGIPPNDLCCASYAVKFITPDSPAGSAAQGAVIRNNTFRALLGLPGTSTTPQPRVVGNILQLGGCASNTVYRYNVSSGGTCGSGDLAVSASALNAGFASPSTHNFALTAGSPAIDAGDPSDYPATDKDGGARPVGARADAGAYEYGSTSGGPDIGAPDTTITSTPPASTSLTTASFGFTATEAATFECRLDGGAWAGCTSPKAHSSLAPGAHTFDVRSTDLAGNIDASPATYTWTVTAADTTPPETTITSGPSGSTTSTTASLGFSATEPVTFECRIDAGSWGACASPKSYSALAIGNHTFDVRATDLAGNVDLTPASRAWAVAAVADTTPPDTAIVSGPSGSTTSTSASLTFSATETVTFECRLDAGAWGACASPKAYSGLAAGAHTFDVRATDTSGNTDLTPASRSWTVAAPSDTTPPDTTITSGPTGSGTSTSASLAFTASESGSTFQCRLDGGTWASCTSPKSYAAMAVGAHTFDVRATDAAGNTDASPATRSWTIVASSDTSPPDTTITGGPAASTTSTTSSVTFTSTESGSTFQCRLDGGTWNACASPEGDSGLAVGAHSMDVRATDAAGNVDPTPATWSWTVVASAPAPPADTTAPDTNLTSGPTTVTTSRSATFEFTATEDPATFRCSLDGSKWSTCASPKDYSSLSRGKHTIRVRGTDAAGNTDATPVSYSWSIVRRTYGATYSFEPLSGRSHATVQAGSLEGACAIVSGSHARLGVRLTGLHVRRSHSAMRISGKVPELAQDGVNARVRVSVRSHGRWHLITSRRVRVRFDGSFRVKAPRRAGKLKVTAVARCG